LLFYLIYYVSPGMQYTFLYSHNEIFFINNKMFSYVYLYNVFENKSFNNTVNELSKLIKYKFRLKSKLVKDVIVKNYYLFFVEFFSVFFRTFDVNFYLNGYDNKIFSKKIVELKKQYGKD
jgi:hypothetical protein